MRSTRSVLHLSESDREARLHVGKHRVVDGANRRRALRGLATRCRITFPAMVLVFNHLFFILVVV